jgi:hypothetical protein
VVTFSEMIDQGTVASGFTLSRGTVPVAGSISYNASVRQATFTPATFLDELTAYAVRVSGVRDLAGNEMAAAFNSTFTVGEALFADDFEGGTAKWTLDTPWGATTGAFKSASHSLTDSPAGNYAATTSVAAASVVFNTGAASSATVSFWLRSRTEANRDFLYLDYNRNGAGWTTLPTVYSGNLGWALRAQTIPLPGGTTSLQIRFRLTSNNVNQYDGVYIDDVVVQ